MSRLDEKYDFGSFASSFRVIGNRADRKRMSGQGVQAKSEETDEYMLARLPRNDGGDLDSNQAGGKHVDSGFMNSIHEVRSYLGCEEGEQV